MTWPNMSARNAPALTACDLCGKTHPETRKHCADCGIASLFLDDLTGLCLGCALAAKVRAER